MKLSIAKKDYIPLLLMGGVIFALTFTVVLRQSLMSDSDYALHMEQAFHFRTLFPYHISYPLWHFLVFVVHRTGWYLLGHMPIAYACAFVTASVNVVIYAILQKILAWYQCRGSAYLAAALCIVMPVYIPWYSEALYCGQLSPVTWHNPTNLIVKPFALLAFFLITEICGDIRDAKPVPRKKYILLSVLVFCSMLAKPSFFQGIVPALGVYILIRLIVCRLKQWKAYLFLCLCFVPAFLVMLVQFYFAFYTGAGEGIGIGWMEVFRFTSPSPLISTLLGLLFPAAYILLNLKKTMRDIRIQISLLFVCAGWLEYALLYEKGARMYHANLMWAVLLACTVVWAVTTGLFFRDIQETDTARLKTRCKNSILFILWILHLICGIYYVCSLLTVEGMWM